jgi:hypothetical protein
MQSVEAREVKISHYNRLGTARIGFLGQEQLLDFKLLEGR